MSQEIISQFYDAFINQDVEKMKNLYHKDVIFNDEAFKNLNYEETVGMWSMLLGRSKDLSVEYHSVIGDKNMAQCTWEAKYSFSKTGRPVHNIIHATMELKDGKIIKHTDKFDFWRWSSMALGLSGKLLGWTPMLRNKVQKMAKKSLEEYLTKS